METGTTQEKTIPEKPDDIKRRTSIDVREDLWDELKVAAIRRKVSLSAAVETAIEHWIKTGAPVDKDSRSAA